MCGDGDGDDDGGDDGDDDDDNDDDYNCVGSGAVAFVASTTRLETTRRLGATEAPRRQKQRLAASSFRLADRWRVLPNSRQMMNSYEFDQPLDLRLKALNLSLSTFNQPHDTYYSSVGGHLDASPMSLNPVQLPPAPPVSHFHPRLQQPQAHSQPAHQRQQAQQLNQPKLRLSSQHQDVPYAHPQTPAQPQRQSPQQPQPHQTHQSHQQAQHLHQHQHQPQAQHPPQQPLQHQQQQRYFNPDYQINALVSFSDTNKNHIRSTSIHCQPLNHHQPHPLASRLNPRSPAHLTSLQNIPASPQQPPSSTQAAQFKLTPSISLRNSSTPTAASEDETSSNQASPITRQHSLVSRYNCKPCGIVFSQPETLRAHQEGYCTKRDRSQTQLRSQSAISPMVASGSVGLTSTSPSTSLTNS